MTMPRRLAKQPREATPCVAVSVASCKAWVAL